jgi:hypothetical protein
LVLPEAVQAEQEEHFLLIDTMFTEQEKNALIAGLNSLVKNSANSLQTAADLLPLALKVQSMVEKKEEPQESKE